MPGGSPPEMAASLPAPGGDAQQRPAPTEVAPWLKRTGLSAWYLIGIAIVIAGIVAGTIRLTPVFVAVFIALVFTALLNPIVNFLSRRMPRWEGVIFALLGSTALFSGLMFFVVNSVVGTWSSLQQQFHHGVQLIIDFIDSLPFSITLTPTEVDEWAQNLHTRGQDYLANNWQRLVGEVVSNAGSVAIFFTIVALSIFVTIFFLLSGTSMWLWFVNMLPSASRVTTNRAAEAGWSSFSGYARGTVIIALVDGGLAWIYLEILRVPLAPALGVLVMIGAFIPMVGAPAAMLVAMVVALATGGIWKALLVGVGIALIGQLEGHVLQPIIMGRQVSLHPVVVGIGVVAGTIVGGLLGAIVVVPFLGVIWAVFNSLYHRDPPLSMPELKALSNGPAAPSSAFRRGLRGWFRNAPR